jgi:hypothetical protein
MNASSKLPLGWLPVIGALLLAALACIIPGGGSEVAHSAVAPSGAGTPTPIPTCVVATVVPSPNVSTGYHRLRGVAAVSPNEAWAVGEYEDAGDTLLLIEHWDGSQWTVVPNPVPAGVEGALHAITAISPNDIWAVGTYLQAGQTARPLTLHWDGALWHWVLTPYIADSANYLFGVSAVAPNDIWAVGSQSVGFGFVRSFTMHWDGAEWTIVPAPHIGTASNRLNAVAAVASNDVWAVGIYNPSVSADDRTLTLHWNGTQWSIVSSPNIGTWSNYLQGVVALSSNEVWAVGHYYDWPLYYKTLTMRWNGTQWSTVPSPNAGYDNELRGVAATSSSDIWAVGRHVPSVDQPQVLHWDGSEWSVVTTPPGTSGQLRAVAVAGPGEAWAVGDTYPHPGQPARTLVERFIYQCDTPTPTRTLTPAVSNTPTGTATLVRTLTPTATYTAVRMLTPTGTLTPTATFTAIATGSATPTVTVCPMTFTDVQTGDYFYVSVRYLYCAGIISGYGDNTFRPFNNTTRGQLAKIVVLAFGIPIYTPPTPTFTDVPMTDPFYQYIETAAHEGIVSGYSDGTFRPFNNVTRGQLCKIVVIAAGWPLVNPSIPTFSDVPLENAFYSYIETAYDHGIISGYADGTFRPGNNATRGQISKIVYESVIQP